MLQRIHTEGFGVLLFLYYLCFGLAWLYKRAVAFGMIDCSMPFVLCWFIIVDTQIYPWLFRERGKFKWTTIRGFYGRIHC